MKKITSEQAVDPVHADWRQECREKSIGEVLQSEEQDVRKMTASETIDSLDVVKCFTEIHGDKQMNVMLNELTGTLDKVLSICFFKK